MAELYVPDGYYKMPQCTCGPNGLKLDLIPNSLYGLRITEACCIHDYMYTYPTDADETWREHADRVFLNNMLRLIDASNSNWFMSRIRYAKARKYFLAVRCFGGPSFWKGKNKAENLVPV